MGTTSQPMEDQAVRPWMAAGVPIAIKLFVYELRWKYSKKLKMVEPAGFELATLWSQTRCATSCATARHF